MVDYQLNEDLSLARTQWGSFTTVDGINEFEQSLGVRLRGLIRDAAFSRPNTADREKINLAAKRVANQYDILDEVDQIVVERLPESGEYDYRVFIEYSSNTPFEETF